MKTITRLFLISITAALLTLPAFCEEAENPPAELRPKDPAQVFYNANALYEKGEYSDAIETFITVLDAGLESGNLYYNIGNSFLKMDKLGYAIYCYEKAKRHMPADSDLKSNLDYARSLAGTVDYPESVAKSVMRRFIYPMKQMSLGAAAVFASVVYLLTVLISALFVANRILIKRYGIIFYVLIAICIYSILAFGIRYYHEEVIKFGIVVEKSLDCKYEPIDKSTTYFNLPEGDKVVVVKTRNGWRQIKRLDGKIGWVPKDSVQEI